MKISDTVEPLVRAAIHAAVRRDFPKLDQSLQQFSDDAKAQQGLELALAIITLILTEVHGGKPSDQQIIAVAHKIAEAEAWSQANPQEIANFLLKLMNGQPFVGSVPSENVIILSYVCAGNLLSSCRRDDEKWWDYLDRVEAAIEAAG